MYLPACFPTPISFIFMFFYECSILDDPELGFYPILVAVQKLKSSHQLMMRSAVVSCNRHMLIYPMNWIMLISLIDLVKSSLAMQVMKMMKPLKF